MYEVYISLSWLMYIHIVCLLSAYVYTHCNPVSLRLLIVAYVYTHCLLTVGVFTWRPGVNHIAANRVKHCAVKYKCCVVTGRSFWESSFLQRAPCSCFQRGC